ncbi:MAG TPA: hypothetical protein VHM25_12835, partial [Polyangiaceae bacterium]|nr:hypothetical protein [Polyangiaceae bacterium]
EIEANQQHPGFVAQASFVEGKYRIQLRPPAGEFGVDRAAGEFEERDDTLIGEGSTFEEALADLAMRRAF